MTKTTILSIFITNLGKYNEGELIGEWVDLPCDESELDEVLERIGIDGEQYEEFFITDFESDYGLTAGEYDNIHNLNEQAQQLADLDEWELDIVSALLDNGYSLENALDKYEDVIVYSDCHDMADVAYQYIEETGMLDSVPDNIRNYFDYEAFGRDMSYDGEFIFTDNGNCIEVI